MTINVPVRQLQYWDSVSQKWITATGSRTVYVGTADSLASLPLQARVTIVSGSITCDDTQLSAVQVQGSVLVPPGAWCDMIDSSVTGSVIAVAGTGLRIANSAIGGSMVATGIHGADDPLSSGANVVCGSTIGGDLAISGQRQSSPWSLGQCGANTVKGKTKVTGNTGSVSVVSGSSATGSAS